jgi:hypothetical protein
MLKINKSIAHLYPWSMAKWENRTKKVAELIPPGFSVLDIGGGMGHLYQHLPKGTDYLSIDIRDWTDKTIIANLNLHFPDVPLTGDVCIVCQGIIEYLDNPFWFLQQIKKYGSTLVITYRPKSPTVMPRLNDLSFQQFKAALQQAGWRVIKEQNSRSLKKIVEKIYLCNL